MANITYKTVITDAIAKFNTLQSKLKGIGAKVDGAEIPTIEGTGKQFLSVDKLLTADAFRLAELSGGTINAGSVAVSPSITKGTANLGSNTGITIGTSAGAYAIPITISGSGESTVTSSAVTVSQSGFVTAGNKINGGSAKITGNITSTTRYINLPAASLSGSIKATSSSAIITEDPTDTAGINIRETLLSKDDNGNYVTSSTEPTSGNYIAIKTTTTASGSGSIGVGWTSGGSISGTGSSHDTYYSIRSASGFSITDKTDKATFAENGNEFNITVSNLVGKFSSAGYIGTGNNTDSSVKVGTVAKSTLTSKVSSFSATATADNNGTLTIKPSISVQHSATAGYTAAVTNAAGTSYTSPYTISSTGLKPENIRYGVSILGVTGSFTNATNPDSSGNQQGAELRYYTVAEDDAHGGKDEHLHSLGMLKGAYAYVDGKLVVGDMNDFSVETSANNTYGASGSGTTIGENNVSVDGSRLLTLTSSATGYVASGVTKFTATLPAAGCTVAGGGLTKGAGSVSAIGANNLTITESASQPASGFYFTTTGSGTVSRAAITDAHTTGWLVAKDATTVSAATSLSSNVATKYYTLASSSLNITGAVTPSNVTLSDTDNGIYIFNASGTTASMTKGYTVGTSKTVGTKKFISKLIVPAGKALGHYTSSTDYADGVSIDGASDSIGKLYTGFVTSGYGELYLRNGGATSYTKVAENGALKTGSCAVSGGGLSGGGLSISAEKGTLTSITEKESAPTSGYYFTISGTRAAISRAAVSMTHTAGWISAGSSTPISASSMAASSATKYYVIPTASTPTGSAATVSVTNATIGSATTYEFADGKVTQTNGSKSGNLSATCTKVSYNISTAGWIPAKTAADITLTGNNTGSGTATIQTNATGSDVDIYVKALYERILGIDYTAANISADA